jgi:predicted PurR-regulated permease PerM
VSTPTPTPTPHGQRLDQVLALVRWLLIIAFVVLGWSIVSFLAGVLAPILAALGIAYLLNPLLERLVRRGTSRTLGAALLLVVFLAAIVATLSILVPRVADQVRELIDALPDMVDNLAAWAHDKFGVEVPKDWKQYLNSDSLKSSLEGPLKELAAYAVGGVFHLLAVSAEILLMPVFTFYFLVDWPHLLHRIDHMIPPRRRRDVREIAHDIDRVVAGWVRGQAISTTILAILYAIGFSIIGIPAALPIGLLVGALTIIPFIGTFVGAAIAALVTIGGTGGDMTMLAEVGLVILCLHLLEAAVLTPKLVGHRVGLSESSALFAVVAGGKLLGFVGVVLAVPIAATIAVLLRYAVRYYEHTSFFGRESDADVVITPAMALIMPGVMPGARIVAEEHVAEPEPQPELEAAPEWTIDPELGQAGAPAKKEDDE